MVVNVKLAEEVLSEAKLANKTRLDRELASNFAQWSLIAKLRRQHSR